MVDCTQCGRLMSGWRHATETTWEDPLLHFDYLGWIAIRDRDQRSGLGSRIRIKDQVQQSQSRNKIKDQDQGSKIRYQDQQKGSRIRIKDKESRIRIKNQDKGQGPHYSQGSRIRPASCNRGAIPCGKLPLRLDDSEWIKAQV